MKYKRIPVVIDAIQFTRDNCIEVIEFTNNSARNIVIRGGKCRCVIETQKGNHTAFEGDFIIKDTNGDFYPCNPNEFTLTYEKINQL